MDRTYWRSFGGAAVALLLSLTARAEIDAKADDLLKRSGAFYKSVNSFSAELAFSVQVTSPGERHEIQTKYELCFQRPNKVSIRFKEGKPFYTLIWDGTRQFAYDPRKKMFAEGAFTGSMTQFLDQKLVEMIDSQLVKTLLVNEILRDNPYDGLTEGTGSGIHAGQEEINGVLCHRIRMVRKGLDGYNLWIEDGARPIIHRVSAEVPRQDPQDDSEVRVTSSLNNWKLGESLPPDSFTFTPPPGSSKIDAISQPENGTPEPTTVANASPPPEPPAQRPAPETKVIVAAPATSRNMAPDFTLELADGGVASLSDLRGKVVILDFWATWCGPCKQGLPLLADFAKESLGKDVAVFAVNLQEDKKTIQDFMRRQRYKLSVAMDVSGSVGAAYGAEAIPLTVIIGKDGSIQATHMGYDPKMKERLSAEVNQLLEGKSLSH